MSEPTFTHAPGVHPAADLFPMMTAEEFAELVDDVRANGLVEPVRLLPDGRILDGRNRVAACQLLGRKYDVRVYDGDDPVGFAISLNVRRRHLSASQRALIVAESLPIFEAEAKARLRVAGENFGERHRREGRADLPDPLGATGKAVDLAAAAVGGVSGRIVAKAKRVKTHAPDLVDDVRAGRITVDRADKIVATRLPRQTRKTRPRKSGEGTMRRRDLDHDRAIVRLVANASDLADVIDRLPDDYACRIDPATVDKLSTSLARSSRALGQLRRRLIGE